MKQIYLPFGERRLRNRKSCSRTVQVDDAHSTYHGHLRDLTVDGAFIEPPQGQKARPGQDLVVTIPFGLRRDQLTLKARVAWVKAEGMGVRFIKTRRR